jgi:pimeloyl-ACP methyl ester carboxylesterase
MTAAERSTLEACPTTRLHLLPNCGHMLPNQKPDWVAELIVATVGGAAQPAGTTEKTPAAH